MSVSLFSFFFSLHAFIPLLQCCLLCSFGSVSFCSPIGAPLTVATTAKRSAIRISNSCPCAKYQQYQVWQWWAIPAATTTAIKVIAKTRTGALLRNCYECRLCNSVSGISCNCSSGQLSSSAVTVIEQNLHQWQKRATNEWIEVYTDRTTGRWRHALTSTHTN